MRGRGQRQRLAFGGRETPGEKERARRLKNHNLGCLADRRSLGRPRFSRIRLPHMQPPQQHGDRSAPLQPRINYWICSLHTLVWFRRIDNGLNTGSGYDTTHTLFIDFIRCTNPLSRPECESRA
ncbi:hypothetical protein EVAR_12740_1 [Eumeta japonica]|uniref:Uncharacterized protein n=1 Tax=Eumeta variegata TaxID=151549 RepID=A0A4C1UPD1_EUMVA|nr:hypothetical protein EVAR_12740_1 [Eumeta japonica]